MTTRIPRPTPPFEGNIQRLIADSTPRLLEADEAPPGAPNVILILIDDVGFGSADLFGGPVPMPTLARVAENGVYLNQFHTTALCSPTRAALLTGRNHHTVHMGAIPEISNSFPAYDSAIPTEAATVAQILSQNGYATGCFGKWHLTPLWEHGPAGPFERWPTGLGFDRFYGILGAESSQWEPAVYDQTTPVQPHLDRDDYHLTEDLAEHAIEWIQQCNATAPGKPFFCYFSTAAMHAPHHVAPEWSDKFHGHFDGGWDALRQEIYERQLDLGVIPEGTVLTERPEQLPAWEDYPEEFRPVAARLMEVFAGLLAHTDAQIGRVLDAVQELGSLENTLVLFINGDNGASGEGTLNGAWSAPSFQNGVPEDPQWLLDHMDDFGTRRCENHYNAGWAWALDAPFQWMKQVASHFGGTRNGVAASWPRGVAGRGELHNQFHHVVDVLPTILEATGVTAPTHVNGIKQLPIEGISMLPSMTGDDPATARQTQYFELLGNRAIYHDGWIAACFHGRLPWVRFAGYEFDGDQEQWELYDIRNDFSQSNNLAAEFPNKMLELQDLFDSEAKRNGVYPLRDGSAPFGGPYSVPNALKGVKKMTYTTAHVRLPEAVVVNLKNSSHRITADIAVSQSPATGVIACQGGNMAGWSLYLDESGRPTYLYNLYGHDLTFVAAPDPLNVGDHIIEVNYVHDGGFAAGGMAALLVDGVKVGSARIEATVPIVFSMSGETFDVGCDTGAPVGPYPDNFHCTAEIRTVTLERLDEPDAETADLTKQGAVTAALASH